MFQNFSLRQNMQIPQENVYYSGTASNLALKFDDLSKSFEIHKADELKGFIKNNVGLIEYINCLIPLINNHFPNSKKCLTFSQDPEFDELDDVTIYIHTFKSDFDDDWKKLDELEKEIFYIDEFSNQIKGLVLLDLWLL